jgi:CheY-like chemotaxis protein
MTMRKYLVVDDNEAFAENLAEILRDAGGEVVIVHSGEAALERVRAERFDLVLTDMKMPAMDGAELVHRLRRFDPGIPAIVITAYSNDNDLEEARRDGLLAVFSKPVPMTRLLELAGVARHDALAALVEDDVAFSDNLSEILRSRGFSVVTAASVLETERLGQVRPFVGIVDLRVPTGTDGEAMKRLAARFPGMPLVVVTAHETVAPPLKCERVFTKPFDPDELLAVLERLYGARANAE